MGDFDIVLSGAVESSVKYHSFNVRILTLFVEKTNGRQCLVGSLSGALFSQKVTEKFKGQLAPDGNRSGPVKGKAGLTARRICRAGGKPELSEPTMVRRTVGDHQLKATLGITGW